MTAPELLLLLNRLGISVNVTGAHLQVNAPIGALTPELKLALRASKTEMIAFLECDRFAQLEQLKAETNRALDVLDEIEAQLGQDDPTFGEQLALCNSKLRPYQALCDLMVDRHWITDEARPIGEG